ncbi:hypothetical protein LINGRAHAP2_LOCUS23367 [Linum grandiflorum]
MSAQDLHQASRKMKTYAVAWIHPNRKLSTRVDSLGHNRPTWNDKFVFRVDEEFLYSDTSAITIEIYAVHWFRDVLLGSVRVLVGSVNPPSRQTHHHNNNSVLRLVRRTSGRPQGIINVGVAILDSSMRSMPLYSGSSAVGYRDLMGQKNNNRKGSDQSSNSDGESSVMYSISNDKQFLLPWIPTPELRRTKSDSSSMMDLPPMRTGGGSLVGGPAYRIRGKSKASSMLTGLESYRNGNNFNKLPKANSRCSLSEIGGGLTKKKSTINRIPLPPGARFLNGSETSSSADGFSPSMVQKPMGRRPPITDSELGPSASEVAAVTVAKMRQLNYKSEESGSESDVMGSWSLESSIEGLQSKLERWRTEDLPVYAGSEVRSDPASSGSSMVSGTGYSHKKGMLAKEGKRGDGFTCLTNICGLQFTIVCGGAAAAKRKSAVKTKKHYRSDNASSISI